MIKDLGFGLMRLPVMDENDYAGVDMDALKQMADVFMEEGSGYFDTAYVYHSGRSETAFREAVAERYERDRFRIADKLPLWELKKRGDQERIFEEQLRRCGVDYFDNYLLHNVNTGHYEIARKFDSFRFIQDKKKEGKIKRIGFSYHDNPELLDEILTAHPEFDFVQLQINYLDWNSGSIQSEKCYEAARKHDKPVIVMEPVKGGKLAKLPERAEEMLKEYDTGMSIPSWAVRFAASLEGVVTVLSGMSDMRQMRDNINTMKDFKPFTQKEFDILRQAVDIVNGSIAIPCTACGYCADGCPQNIAIPKYFDLYNAEIQSPGDEYSLQKMYYDNYSKIFGRASDCVKCRLCEEHCPQHIEITARLEDVANIFEKRL